MKRKHWSEYSIDETQYGFHKYGIGVYRFDKDYNPVEWWLDYESATPEEKKLYKAYLMENGWDR